MYTIGVRSFEDGRYGNSSLQCKGDPGMTVRVQGQKTPFPLSYTIIRLNNRENTPFINDSITLGVEHWEDEIQFLNDRLSGKHGEIDDEDDEAYEDALKIAKVNLADAKSHLNEG